MGLLGAYGLINNQDEMQKAQLLAQAQAQQGLLPAQPAPQGLLGRITSTPGFWQGLSQAGQGLVQASQGRPGYKPTWAQGISAGLGGFNQGMQSYQEQIASDAAARMDALIKQKQLELETKKANQQGRREIKLNDQTLLVDDATGNVIAKWAAGMDPSVIAKIKADAEAKAEADKRAAFGDASGLRKELVTQITPYKNSMDYADRLATTLDNYQPGISSNAAVKLYNLMIEPSSVVRGEDFDAAIGTGGAFQAFVSNVKSLSEGMELPPNVRAELRRYADIYKSLAERKARDIASGYVSAAQSGGIDPALLLIDNYLGAKPGGPAGGSGKGGNPNNPANW